MQYYLNNFLSFKIEKARTEEDVKKALEEVENSSVSIRATAEKYGMTKGTLRKRIKMKEENTYIVGGGRNPTFDKILKRN